MAESFANLDNILRDWGKDKVQKGLVEALNRYEKKEEERKSLFLLENDSEKYSSSLSGQSSEIRPNTKLVLKLFQGKKPFLCLEIKKPNKQNIFLRDVSKAAAKQD